MDSYNVFFFFPLNFLMLLTWLSSTTIFSQNLGDTQNMKEKEILRAISNCRQL
jgi:hypothetical protein